MSARHVLTIVAVADVARAQAFYVGAFGWATSVETPVYVELALPDGMRLGLYEREGFAKNTGRLPPETPTGGITATEIYLHCDDLDTTFAAIERAGGRLLSALSKRAWGDEAAYFADPDGNVVVVARPLES